MRTIAEIYTPLAVGGIGIVRVSGPEALAIAARVFRPAGERDISSMKGFTSAYGRVFDQDGQVDEAILSVYRAPKSYTGEDVAELSCHGGVYVLQRVLRAVLDQGAVLAGPGEFTKRAFLNGKVNLTQAEAVMDLISSQNKNATRAALSARDGALSQRVQGIEKILLGLAGHLAAWVDYPEEDIEEVETGSLLHSLSGCRDQLEQLLSTYDLGRILREGVDTAIIGRPNVGKSTLMNLLAGAQRSIVTDIPGTTRDVVEDVIRLEDVVLNLADTAGIRATDDPVESVGVDLARRRMEDSGLVLAVFDSSDSLTREDRELLEALQGRPAVAVLNKTDLPRKIQREEIAQWIPQVVEVSAANGEGMDALSAAIREVLSLHQIDGSAPILANERQRGCILRAKSALDDAIEAVGSALTLDAATVCIDEGLNALLELTGERATDAVVGQVFAQFCVGK